MARQLLGDPGGELFLLLEDEIPGVLGRPLDRVGEGSEALVMLLEHNRDHAKRRPQQTNGCQEKREAAPAAASQLFGLWSFAFRLRGPLKNLRLVCVRRRRRRVDFFLGHRQFLACALIVDPEAL